jgi:hypothetical protein
MVVLAQAISHRPCLRSREAEPTSEDLDNQAVVGRVILVVPDNQAIGRETSADLADRVTAQATSADLVHPVIARVTSGAPADPATAQVILADQANPGANSSKTFPAASAIARDGRTGARSIATTFAIGGRTTPATSTIGSMTPGGMTTTSTGLITRASDIGRGPRGER